jgi:hypothetical protein
MIRAPHEQLVRLDTSGRHRDARRRLAELYLKGGSSVRNTQAALILLKELTDPGKNKPTAQDYYLLSNAHLDPYTQISDEDWEKATVAAEEAQRLDPGDVRIANHLADLYVRHRKDPAKASRSSMRCSNGLCPRPIAPRPTSPVSTS